MMTRRNRDRLEPVVRSIRGTSGSVHPFGSDARREEQMVPFIERVRAENGPIEVAVCNVGANVQPGITETTSQIFFKARETCCFSGCLMGREVAETCSHIHCQPRSAWTFESDLRPSIDPW